MGPGLEAISYRPLVRDQAYIGGQWRGTGDGFPVVDPADGTVLLEVASCRTAEAEEAVAAAAAAFREWKARTAGERAAFLRAWHDLMVTHAEDLATLMSLEQGKPLAEARGEVAYGASFVSWFAEEARRSYGEIVPGHQRDRRLMVFKEPIGGVGAITPWNFPIAMITRKAGPALAAGCTIVVKPAAQTPLCALALAALADEAGLPPGVFNVVPSRRAAEIGAVLTGSPLVCKLSFTGSTEIGRELLRQCAGSVKKVSMELGGNAPVVVFDDADLEKAVAGTLAAKFRNSGQTCVCANRIYVQSGIYDRFAERFASAVGGLRVGAALAGLSEQGPLIDEAALAKVEEHVADARAKGGRVLVGGDRHALGGTFYQPTVVVDARDDMLCAREETFGPVAPLFRFDTDAEAIARANDTEFGLAAYVFVRDVDRVWHAIEGIEAGMVGVNTGLISTEVAPFGGVKQSGLGREGSRHGLDDYMELKYVCFGVG